MRCGAGVSALITTVAGKEYRVPLSETTRENRQAVEARVRALKEQVDRIEWMVQEPCQCECHGSE